VFYSSTGLASAISQTASPPPPHCPLLPRLRDSSFSERFDFRDKVIKLAMGYGHLIVATASQCYVYTVQYNTAVPTWSSSPYIFDLKDTVSLIVQAGSCFLMAGQMSGVQVYNYEGYVFSFFRLSFR
jgi:hypothetical protein